MTSGIPDAAACGATKHTNHEEARTKEDVMQVVIRMERNIAPMEDLSLSSSAAWIALYRILARQSINVYSMYPISPMLNPIIAIMYHRTLQGKKKSVFSSPSLSLLHTFANETHQLLFIFSRKPTSSTMNSS